MFSPRKRDGYEDVTLCFVKKLKLKIASISGAVMKLVFKFFYLCKMMMMVN